MSKHFVLDEHHNLIEAYSAQEVLSVLEQAIADGSLANVVAGQAIVDKLKCCVGGATHRIAFVTQAKYNELSANGNIIADCLYFITDDTTADDCERLLCELNDYINGLKDGTMMVQKASHAQTADKATNADNATTAHYAKMMDFGTTIFAPSDDGATELLLPDSEYNQFCSEWMITIKNGAHERGTCIIHIGNEQDKIYYSTASKDGVIVQYSANLKKFTIDESTGFRMDVAFRVGISSW